MDKFGIDGTGLRGRVGFLQIPPRKGMSNRIKAVIPPMFVHAPEYSETPLRVGYQPFRSIISLISVDIIKMGCICRLIQTLDQKIRESGVGVSPVGAP